MDLHTSLEMLKVKKVSIMHTKEIQQDQIIWSYMIMSISVIGSNYEQIDIWLKGTEREGEINPQEQIHFHEYDLLTVILYHRRHIKSVQVPKA